VKAEELIERLDDRIGHHRARAAGYEAQLATLGEAFAIAEDEDSEFDAFRSPERPQVRLERRRIEHVGRADLLAFIRAHIVVGEVYRLDEGDLRTIEILPRRTLW
jgi:hypothetical protein